MLKKFKGTLNEYQQLHSWIRKHKPKPECCELCKKTKIVLIWRRGPTKRIDLELANISGKYKKDIDDFMWICHKCHLEFDGTMVRSDGKKCRYFCFGKCYYYKNKCVGSFKNCKIYQIMNLQIESPLQQIK